VSPLDAGLYRASLVIAPAGRSPVRVTSLVTPAYGGELSRLRLEALEALRGDMLGSFFEPARRGAIYAMPADRGPARLHPADRSGWSYDGPSLRPRLGTITRVRVLVERVTGAMDGQAFAWTVDRGLVLTGADGADSLLLAEPDYGEAAAFVPALGAWRALLDATAPLTPGATTRELLGHGDREGVLEVRVDVEDLAARS
jgi:hypothetical protein